VTQEPQAVGAVMKTVLLCDLVGSTKMVERLGDARAFELFGRHDRIARDLLQEHGGREIDKTDGFLLLFDRPIDGVRFAVSYHRALAALSQTQGTEIAARVGIHLGEVYLRENPPEDVARGAKPLEVEGLAKPVAARLMSLALGGQTLMTRGAFDIGRRAAVDEAGLEWLAHGAYLFKGVDEPVEVFEVGLTGAAPLHAPPDSEKARRAASDETIVGWRPAQGQEVPGRSNWCLDRKLGEGGFGEVWLATHKTGEVRVFKFCFEGERLRSLQREVTLFRLLKETLGSRDDIARVIDWSFDQAPYFIELEYSEGGSLVDWAGAQGGIEGVPLEARLEIVARAADALAAAHSVGVLHKDLKPANILVQSVPSSSEVRIRLTDFGVGLALDQDRLRAAGITVLGFQDTVSAHDTMTSGTPVYMAPELLEGKPATMQADLYALGVIMYQLVVGDLNRVLGVGWEREVGDELLREDIACLVDRSPDRSIGDPSGSRSGRRMRHLSDCAGGDGS
jgi:class 3 adenylate cyclase/tRNA A-37 threonylcarbamoyl transferase component Bud32